MNMTLVQQELILVVVLKDKDMNINSGAITAPLTTANCSEKKVKEGE